MESKFLTANRRKNGIYLIFWMATCAMAYAADLPVLLIVAVLAAIVEIFMLTFNRGDYFRVEEGRIHARYHWFGRLDCDLEDLVFIYGQPMTLNLLLKNGKRCSIAFLANAEELCAEVRRLTFSAEQEPPTVLTEQLEAVNQKRRRDVRWVIAGCVLIFVNIALMVLATGGREADAFSSRDWTVCWVMTAVECATVFATFWMARRCGMQLMDVYHLRHRLQSAVIGSQILPSNCVKSVYADTALNGRVVVCGLPNDSSLYYIVQEINDAFELVTSVASPFFDREEDLMEDLALDLIDITSWFAEVRQHA